MIMNEKALKYFHDAWNKIKSGDLFSEDINTTFEYSLKNIWNTEHKNTIKHSILETLPHIYEMAKNLDDPPPVFYILISLKDAEIGKEIQNLAIQDFVKNNATESSTYQLLNFVETFSDKQVPIEGFIKHIIVNVNLQMNKDMLEALAYMTSKNHPNVMKYWLNKFVELGDKSLIKSFVNMSGRKALLELLNLQTPGQVQKIMAA